MIKNDLEQLTASEARAELASGRLTSQSLVAACLARIADRDQAVRAWAHIDADRALAAARASDALRSSGKPVPPLSGIPVGIKDIIDTSDFPTELGSPVFAGRRPSADAFIVSRTEGCRRHHTGQNGDDGAGFLRTRKNAQSTPPRTHAGRIVVRIGRRRRRLPGAARASARRRLDRSSGPPLTVASSASSRPSALRLVRACCAQSAPLDTIGGYARSVEDIALLFDAIGGFDISDRDMLAGPRSSLVSALREPRQHVPRFAFVRSPAWPQRRPRR